MRIGIVGAGAMAEYHAKRFSGLDGVVVTAVCDHLPSRARAFAGSLGLGACFLTPAEMVASGEVDAVAIASCDLTHASSALAALERGLPVFCEKPMARRLGEAEAMAAAARSARVPTMVNFSKRNGGLLDLAARLVSGGRFGGLFSIELDYRQSWLLQDSWGDWRTTPRWKWRLMESQSTYGALGDLGSHLFDAALLLAGAGAREGGSASLEVLSCSAIRFVPAKDETLEGKPAFESFEASLSLASVGIAIRAGWRFPGCLDDFRALLRCEGGDLEIAPSRSRSALRVVDSAGKAFEIEAGPWASTYERFASLVSSGESPDPARDPDFERGLEVQRLVSECALLADSRYNGGDGHN